jgi:phosphoribosyl-ATP pyrophosphohydrolase/phosphoribosyl-AMP cyclohydrolase/histidinol dehydrogenase
MGGTKPTFVPHPTFIDRVPSEGHLSAVGRCRVNPKESNEFVEIIQKNVEQSQVDNADVEDEDKKSTNKKLKKKFMKQGVAMAQSFLVKTLGLDVSIINVEILLEASTIIQSKGCVVACFLDAGCDKIAVSGESIETILEAMDVSGVPKQRLVAHFDYAYVETLLKDSSDMVSNIFSLTNNVSVNLSKCDVSNDTCQSILEKISGLTGSDVKASEANIILQVNSDEENVEEVVSFVSKFCAEKDTPCGTISLIDPTAKQLGMTYAACIRTDREDGLYTTVVCTRSGEALGLVYSSKESIVAALECGRGVYYSRSRNGLWRKGDTSGHYQTLHLIDVDCDGDALRFTVTQRGDDCAAFCHLNTLSCWGEPRGLRHLEGTLKSRLKDAPAGSYTKRLFDDSELLRDKLVEEAQELSEADEKHHVAEELADVLYFAMVKAAKAGVSIDDAVAELDKRTRKVTRRKGDSKSFRIDAGNAILQKKI